MRGGKPRRPCADDDQLINPCGLWLPPLGGAHIRKPWRLAGVPGPCLFAVLARLVECSERSPRSLSTKRVAMKPGAIALTRILCGASSRAWLITSRFSAAFLEP